MIALSSQPPSLLRLLPIAATARLSAVRNPARLINYPMQFARNFQIGAQPDRLFLPLQVSPSINSSCKESRLLRRSLRGKRTFLCASLSAGKMELWSLFADESKKTGNYWKKKNVKKNVCAGSTQGGSVDVLGELGDREARGGSRNLEDEICSSLLVESGKWFRG